MIYSTTNKPNTQNKTSEFSLDANIHDDGTAVNNAEISRAIQHERDLAMSHNTNNMKKFSKKLMRKFKKKCDMHVQSSDMYAALKDTMSSDKMWSLKLIEDIIILVKGLTDSKNAIDYSFTIINFVKLRTGTSIFNNEMVTKLSIYLKTLFGKGEELQSSSLLSDARSYLNKYEEIKNSPIFEKVYKFSLYAMSLSLFDKIGLSFDKMGYTKLEQEAVRRKHKATSLDFIHMLADTLLFLCEKGYQIIKTGNIDCIFHSPSTYADWFDDATMLIRQSTLLHDPDAHGFTECEFLSNLKSGIERGTSILKHASRIGQYEHGKVRELLSRIRLIEDECLTSTNARQHRTPPFSVLIYGESSIGKSTILQMLQNHFGKVKGLPLGDEYMFTRNASAKFWDGFRTSQWCVILDDVAYLNPNKAASGDPSCLEFIQVVNGVPFVPDQASLSDKGRTPLKAQLVIATTNTEDLNAHHYFSHASAAQRRFPFIIEPKPKPEYTKNETMLDASAIPADTTGYPDYWTWTVKAVRPVSIKSNQVKADMDILFQDADLKTFLNWYNSAILNFDKEQTKVAESTKNIKETHICKSCYLPLDTMCECEIQSLVTDFMWSFFISRMLIGFLAEVIVSMARIYYCSWYVRAACKLFPKYVRIKILNWYLRQVNKLHSIQRRIIKRMFWHALGSKVQKSFETPDFLLKVAGVIIAGLSLYKITQMFTKVQGADESIPAKSKDIGTKPNVEDNAWEDVWIKNDFALCPIDLTPTIMSAKGLSIDEIHTKFLRNCVAIFFETSTETFRPSKAICLKGNYYLLNNHSVPDLEIMPINIFFQLNKAGVNSNRSFLLNDSRIFRFPERDLCIIHLDCLPPKADLTPYFATKAIQCKVNGTYLKRDNNGADGFITVNKIIKCDNMPIPALNIVTDCWSGKYSEPTSNGDCGAILVGHTPRGPVILGIHVLGNTLMSNGYTLSVDSDFINKFFEERSVVQSGIPLISSETAQRELGDLHKKSVFRYMEAGTADVHGSFLGFRAKMKSNVETTPMEKVLAKDGYTVKYGKPEMSSYVPWRTAALDMLNPVSLIHSGILDDCIASYSSDILSGITKERLSQIEIYDNFTAVNGAPGVLYVDKMNRNTSAGLPWKKGKKHFLTSIAPMHGMQDPVEVSDEIMNRVDKIIDAYQNEQQAHPVFCAHLKDEAVSFAKMEAGKTRVFTGAPFDWSIVVRKYMLSVIRVIQSERFLFEAAPGTIAQSTEWGDIYKYLTQFGTDRIVAGDYKAYDKRMPPQIILGAYKIIRNLCVASGNYTTNDLRVIDGIAHDTAYPLVDFNGDLVKFHGTNPSGHPLTVIINSLANSLYMRYAYACLSPTHDLTMFKKHVALMTYGDDNIMGVSVEAPWYNHTAIAAMFASMSITYTMAEKTAQSVPFINISEASFLKRTWIYDDEVEAYLCPLEHDSIEKMLTVWVRSKSISQQEQCIAVISSAVREYFFYGKTIFRKKRLMFQGLIQELELESWVEISTLPTYDTLKSEFWRHSNKLAKGE